ncbi:MAG TPA: DUF1698 domain-containing protein [Gaiellaceae bacterium]|nr:DUF1698 domain-containing protein [Gaiellaceae bacterium]
MKRRLRILLRPRELARAAQRRFVLRAAPRLGLVAYAPWDDYRTQLEAQSEHRNDSRPIRDKRPTTAAGEFADLTITVEGLEDMLAGLDLGGARILEVGPKYGVHSLWIDERLGPSELVFCDFASDRPLHEEWVGRLRSPHRFVYGDLRTATELLELEPFGHVFFLGVLYHTVNHLELLRLLNRVTRPGGTMLLETTIDPREDASVRLRWPANQKAKAVPSYDALRLLLAWTGWGDVTRFTDYRPGSSEAALLCVKTAELEDATELAGVVRAHRPA